MSGRKLEESPDRFGIWMYEQTSQQLEKLRLLWHELYGKDREIEKAREETVMKHVISLLNDMVEEEEENKEKTIERVEGLIKEQATLEKELHIEIKANVNESAPLCEIEANLQNALESYRLIKTERLDKLKNYTTKEAQLCRRLGLIPKYSDYQGVPSEADLFSIHKYLIELECEEAQREAIFIEKKDDIVELFNRLEVKPTLSFETMVVRDSEKDFKLTDDNMKRLEELLISLKKQEERAKAESEELLGKLSLIWERLKESNETREQFLITHAGYGKSAINGLKKELLRCEELKRQHIERYIQEVRNELESWWDKLRYSDEQRDAFTAFYSREFCEELLELHEHEVSKLRQFYEDNRAIYQLVDERNKLWEKMMELSDKGKNSDRLFKNRGGQLLKEEKERKQIARDLPKIEKELKRLLSEFEAQTGSAFVIDGIPFLEHMEDQWKENTACKEAQKIARKVANATMALTPSAVSKRKYHNTPSSSQPNISKRPRIAVETPQSTTRNNTVKILRSQNTSTNKKIPTIPRPQRQVQGYPFVTNLPSGYSFRNRSPSTNTSNSSLASYSLFQEHLDIKDKTHTMPCRSSTSTRTALKESNQTMRTPMKSTPMKSTPIKTTMMKTPRSASSKIPTPNRFTGPRLTTARGKLPIII